MNPSPTRIALTLAALANLFPLSAFGQSLTGPDGDLTRQLEQVRRETRLLATPDLSAGDRALVDYGGYLTTSYFSVDTSAGDNRALRQYDLNLYARVNLDGAHEFFVRNRLQYRDYNSGDETATDDDGLQNYLEEAYYRFDLARYLAAYKGESTSNNFTLTAGRQFVEWATGLVLSQYLDGLKADLSVGPATATLLAGVTTYGTTDFDTARPNFDKSTYRGFFGGQLSYQIGQHRPFIYALVQRDFNEDREVDLTNGSAQFEYNSYYLGIGSTGNLTDQLRYTTEFVYEGGRTFSGPVTDFNDPNLTAFQTKEQIQAWAAQSSLEYLFADPYRSKASSTFIIASGESDRQGSSDTIGGVLPGERDHAFNALGLVSAGYAFAPQISNLAVLKLSASTFPFAPRRGVMSRLQLGGDLLFYGKTLDKAPIDETTTTDRFLGTEVGTYLNWRILEDVTFQIRYGVFFPGDAIPSDETRQFLYTSLTYSF